MIQTSCGTPSDFGAERNEALRVRLVRGIEHDLPSLDHGSRLAVVNHGWREKLDPGVAVLLVIYQAKNF